MEQHDGGEAHTTPAKTEKWAKSEAKRLLRADIIAGRVKANMNAVTVYGMRNEYKKWPLPGFKTNLANLKVTIGRDYARMLRDCEFYGHDMAVLQEFRLACPLSGAPFYKSDAKRLLVKDVQDNVHLKIMDDGKKISPLAIYNSRPENKAFSLSVFRDFLHQEIKRQDKMKSKIRFGKKKLRTPVDVVSSDMIGLIDEYNKKGVKKKAKNLVIDLKRQTKMDDMAALPKSRQAAFTIGRK
jgi:hypothetical protein